MTSRDHNISVIEALYPADAEYPETAEIGRRLLVQAKETIGDDWRDESDAVLEEYARLCRREEARSLRDVSNRARGLC
jgi:hypothetical protein